jgi:hypothetical protein
MVSTDTKIDAIDRKTIEKASRKKCEETTARLSQLLSCADVTRSLAAIFTRSAQRVGLHLAHHVASVCLHRDLADAQFGTDLLIQSPETTNASPPVRGG